MPVCQVKRINRRRLCSGDLNTLIEVRERSFVAPQFGVDFDQAFSTVAQIWAGLETTDGRNTFYLTNLGQNVTHVFSMRWFDGLTAEKWIYFEGENYDIVSVENLEQRNEWGICYCNVRGSADVKVNNA